MKKYLIGALALFYAGTAAAEELPLLASVKNGNLQEAQTLLNNGAYVNIANEKGNTALHYAVAAGNAEMVRFLLEHGADVNAPNAKGWTPLQIAEKKDVNGIYQLLNEKQRVVSVVPDSAGTAAKTQQTAVQTAETVNTISVPEKVAVNVSPLSDRVNRGDEEIIYCLNFLGLQGEQKNMTAAAGYFAVEAGVSKERHDIVAADAKVYFENSSESAIKQRADECAAYITPKQVAKQNQIIRSLNKSMGY